MDQKIINIIAGFIAGAISCVTTFPLQVIQVQQQVSKSKISIFQTVQNIYINQGFKGYYYGLSPGVWCYSIFYGTYFYTYDKLKESTNLSPFLTSYLAAAIGSIISNPWQVVRVRRQTCILDEQLHMKPHIRDIYRQEGARALCKGLGSTLLKNMELSLFMTVYEKLTVDYRLSPVYASFTGKLVAASVTYPLDSFRSLRRNGKIVKEGQITKRKPLSSLEIIKRFRYKPISMYSGYPTYLIKSVPACVIAFSVNQYLKN